jgi:hypothetical protein
MMRPTDQLLKISIGNPDLAIDPRKSRDKSGDFDIFDVRLPMPDFRGFPPAWTFAILNRSVKPSDAQAADEVIDHAQRLIALTEDSKLLVMVSDDPNVSLETNFGRLTRNVFCLDHRGLPNRQERRKPQDAPFVHAVRRKLPANAPALLYSPYVRKKPVRDWRFFGRERELDELVKSNDNIIIVGGRRIGKTSLMMEAERHIRQRGDEAFFISVMELKTKDQVTRAILQKVSPRDAVAAYKKNELLHENLLSAVLQRLANSKTRTTLLLDEIGNVFEDRSSEDWNYFGAFRNYTSSGSLRIIFSCFSEEFHDQLIKFAGPFINFAHTERLRVFSEAEARQLVLSPLEFWTPLNEAEKGTLMEAITSMVGTHPLLLQYYCLSLFESAIKNRGHQPLIISAQRLLSNKDDLVACFSDPVEEIFYKLRWATLQYLFLRRCHEMRERLRSAVIDDDWLKATLASLGYEATTNSRRNLLDGLEMHGLCSAFEHDRRRQKIATPIIYHFIQKTEASVEGLLEKLRADIPREAAVWRLERIGAGA